MRFYILATLVILVDQVSKIWIRLHFDVGEQIEVWAGILYFIRYENAGIAFSMLQGYGRLFVPVAVLVVGFILYYRSQLKTTGIILDIGTALLVGGAIGNAIDRVLYNQVTDFIHFNWNHGILNLADYAINFGIILFFLGSFLHDRKNAETV